MIALAIHPLDRRHIDAKHAVKCYAHSKYTRKFEKSQSFETNHTTVTAVSRSGRLCRERHSANDEFRSLRQNYCLYNLFTVTCNC